MGKIKEYIAELAETFQDMLWHTSSWGAAIDQMAEILSPDEFEFFNDHMDMIKEIIHMDDDSYPANEARGLKGDVLRPYGGRKARSKMGYGRGNRASYNPKSEIDTEGEILRQEALMQDVEDDQRGPITSRIIDDEEVFDVEPRKVEWPEEMDDEMLSGHDHMGDPDMDYDLDYTNDPDEDIYPSNESLMMPSINEYWDDEKEEQRQWDAAENRRRRFKEKEQTAGEYSEEDERDFVKSQKGLYVKVGKSYMPALYHTPDMGPTDGKIYRRNRKTGGYYPTKR